MYGMFCREVHCIVSFAELNVYVCYVRECVVVVEKVGIDYSVVQTGVCTLWTPWDKPIVS